MFFLLIITALSVFTAAAQSPSSYSCSFETPAERSGWSFRTGYGVSSRFAIGTAAHRMGAHAMYVSPDGGITAGYVSTSQGFITVAYRRFTLDAGDYDVAFDLYTADSLPTVDVARLACFPTVGIDGSVQTPSGASNGAGFPELVDDHSFRDSDGTVDFIARGWRTVQGRLTIPAAGDYWLAFYFKETGGAHSENAPGACIDNIRIASVRDASHCTAMVKNIDVRHDLSSFHLSWQGNAAEYQLIYYRTTSSSDTAYTVVSGITGESHTIPTDAMPEGTYNFCIRPVCGSDTGIWVERSDVLLYRSESRCIDYLHLDAPGVKCTKGTFADPYAVEGVDPDIHSVRFRGDEYDRLTGYKLKTVPDGAIASVRLSDWAENPASSGSVEYSYRVQPDAEVLLLRYAAVLQYESDHTKPEEQTRFHVEVLDSAGTLLSPCTEVDFNALDVSQGNTRGWNTYLPSPDETSDRCPVKWLDWSVLGIDLQPYVGRSISIRITLHACVADVHFAYAYFTLDCSDGDLEGVSCDEIPTHFTAPEGFDYLWYRMSDGSVVSDALLSDGGRTFTPLSGDTCSYFVDLIYPENDACRFTLRAYTLPRVPRSDASFRWNPHDCRNFVDVTNLSAVWSYPKDMPEVLQPDTIDSYFWDFGIHGTSCERSPQLVLPHEGDTFTVTLRTGFNGCFHSKEFLVEIPAMLGENFGTDTAWFYKGDSIVLNGTLYDSPGDYIDTVTSVYGCDSIISLHIIQLCPDSVPGALDVSLASDYGDLCFSDDEERLNLSYTIIRGTVSAFSVDYGASAEAVGFTDIDSSAVDGTTIALSIPAAVRPDYYTSLITFYDSDCGRLTVPFDFDILYPASVVTQRWNDVLAVTNADHNGGYTFSAFQWYLDGVPLDGQTRSQLYDRGNSLHFDGEYRVLLTRAGDSVSVMTCPYTPTRFDEQHYTEVSTVLFGGSALTVDVDGQAVATLYSVSGIRYSEQHLNSGTNSLAMPAYAGIYLLRIVHSDGRVDLHRIVVK